VTTDLHGQGPDGSNLLGFLCAVGALATLTRIWPDGQPRLRWAQQVGWRPVWTLERQASTAEVVDVMERVLQEDVHGRELIDLGDELRASSRPARRGRRASTGSSSERKKLEGAEFQRFAERAGAAARSDDRRWADFAAAFGIAIGDAFFDTPLNTHTMGQLKFFPEVLKLIKGTNAEHLHRALFEPWRYLDPSPTMRWDPADDRRHAYRADNPADSRLAPIRTVRGANRLAIEALPCFPLIPVGARPIAIGFTHPDRKTPSWRVRWPIWTEAIPLDTLRTLLTHPHLQDAPRSSLALLRLGISEVFMAERNDQGYRSFTPGAALLGGRTP
jgi:hypothetical protein